MKLLLKISQISLATLAFFLLIGAHKLYTAIEKKSVTFANQIVKEYGMDVLLFGPSSLLDIQNDTWSFSFIDYHPRTIEEVRQIGMYIVDQLWQYVNKEPIYMQYRMERFQTHPKLEKPEITPDHIGFKISYWDESMERRGAPYISLVKYVNQKFYFYYADPKTQELQEPIVETFEEAKSKLTLPAQ